MSIFGNDDPPPATFLPSAPAPQEIMDFTDEIAGFQETTVTGPDGRKKRVRTRLPRTPEEEALYQRAGELMTTSLKNIQELYQYDPSSVVSFEPLIATFASIDAERQQDLEKVADLSGIAQSIERFKNIQRELLDRSIRTHEINFRERLASQGLTGSTAEQEMRAAMGREEILLREQSDLNAEIFGEELASRRLGREKTAYDIREQARGRQLEGAQMNYALRRQHAQDMEAKRRQALAENQNLLSIASSVRGEDQNKVAMSRMPELTAQIAANHSASALAHHNAEVNRHLTQHQINMDTWSKKPESFGSVFKKLGASGLGFAMGGA